MLPRVQVTYLFVRFLQMLHQNGNHDVNQNELGHQDKNDEEQRREIRGHATISQTIVAVLAFFPQSVFHYAVPVVTGGYPEQGQKGHAEGSEVCVFAKALAWVKFVTL